MLKRFDSVVVLLSSMLLLIAAPVIAYPLDLETDKGRLTLQQTPQQIAVFDLAVLDNLDTLGIEVAGLPQALLPRYLAEYGQPQYMSIGNLFKPDYAALNKLKPDLIFIGERTEDAYKPLNQLAPVLEFSHRGESFVEAVSGNLRLLGQIFNREALAETKISALKQAVKSNQILFSQQKGLVLFAYKGQLIPHAPNERFGMFYELLGIKSTALPARSESGTLPKMGTPEAKKLHAQRLTDALAEQPDWLIILDRGAVKGEASKIDQTLATNPVITASAAWKKEQVFYLDAPSWYLATGGYQGLMKTLHKLQALAKK